MRKFFELISKTVRWPSAPLKPKTKLGKAVDLVFGKYLLTTNIVSSGVLMGIGDMMCQEIEIQRYRIKKRYDWVRIGNMFIVGCLCGPLNHYFYKWMDKIIPKADFTSATKKILLDQILMSPACVVLFFYSAGLLEKQTVNECTVEMKEKFITVYTVSSKFMKPQIKNNDFLFCYRLIGYFGLQFNLSTFFI